jgi:pyruvate kinase
VCRDFSAKPFNTVQAAAVALAKACIDAKLDLAIVVSDSGEAAAVVTKYRPNVPLVVVTSRATVASNSALRFGQQGLLVSQEEIKGDTKELIDR